MADGVGAPVSCDWPKLLGEKAKIKMLLVPALEAMRFFFYRKVYINPNL